MKKGGSEEVLLHKLDIDHLISKHFLVVGSRSKVKGVAKRIYEYMREHDDTVPSIYVVDAKKRILGELTLMSLIRAHDDEFVGELARSTHSVPDRISKERLVRYAAKTKTDRLLVLDDDERPIGVIYSHDLLSLAMREAQGRSLGLFAGAHQNERSTDGPLTAVLLRYKWLILNLATALLATFTVSLFSNTLSQMVILAAYMPLVAGMGGNAGSQAVSVMVRGIALGEVTDKNSHQILLKEVTAGFLNGIIVGVIMAGIAVAIGQPPLLGLVLGLALVINLIVAGIFGAGVPLTLKALRLDPALGASIFVTTATDVLGFIAFLGLATIILL
jgi:magnesium transporter